MVEKKNKDKEKDPGYIPPRTTPPPRGTNVWKGQPVNPSTGEKETAEQQAARNKPKTFYLGGKEVSKEEYKQGKETAKMESEGGYKARSKEELAEAGLIEPPVKPTEQDALNQELETGGFEKVPGRETIETETIIQTDVSGFQREIQMPVGTQAKIDAGLARREGRVPFEELPGYQQFLAQTAVTGVSPGGIVKGGKFINSATKQLGNFMKTNLGKYVSSVAVGSGIITWLASDNIIGSMSIYGRDLAEDVKWGAIDSEEALIKFEEGEAFVEKGRAFIRTATILNPLLWPFRSIILANADAAELALKENKDRITRGG